MDHVAEFALRTTASHLDTSLWLVAHDDQKDGAMKIISGGQTDVTAQATAPATGIREAVARKIDS